MFAVRRIRLLRVSTWLKVALFAASYFLVVEGVGPALEWSDGPNPAFLPYLVLMMAVFGVGFWWCADAVSTDLGHKPVVTWPGWRVMLRRGWPYLGVIAAFELVFLTLVEGRDAWTPGVAVGLLGAGAVGLGFGSVLSVGIFFLRRRWNA